NLQICWQERTRVQFTALSDSQLDTYLATREWQGCSGAYAIQEDNDPYVRALEGSWSNVVGLPMETLERVLRNLPNLCPFLRFRAGSISHISQLFLPALRSKIRHLVLHPGSSLSCSSRFARRSWPRFRCASLWAWFVSITVSPRSCRWAA